MKRKGTFLFNNLLNYLQKHNFLIVSKEEEKVNINKSKQKEIDKILISLTFFSKDNIKKLLAYKDDLNDKFINEYLEMSIKKYLQIKIKNSYPLIKENAEKLKNENDKNKGKNFIEVSHIEYLLKKPKVKQIVNYQIFKDNKIKWTKELFNLNQKSLLMKKNNSRNFSIELDVQNKFDFLNKGQSAKDFFQFLKLIRNNQHYFNVFLNNKRFRDIQILKDDPIKQKNISTHFLKEIKNR